LNVLANFTWASCMTDAADVLNQTALTGYRGPFLPGFGMRKDFGRCDFDINKVVHFSGIYELPFGHDRHFLHTGKVVNAILGGWDTNWIYTLQDGQPGTVSMHHLDDNRLRLQCLESSRCRSVYRSAHRESLDERGGLRHASCGDNRSGKRISARWARAQSVPRAGLSIAWTSPSSSSSS
jgi:phosphatidylserine/phosphatidylglycerophosphate/cardiolipin synthase-like enzyme